MFRLNLFRFVFVVLLLVCMVAGFAVAAAQESTEVPTLEIVTLAPTEYATVEFTATPSPEATVEPTPTPTPDPNPLPDEPPVATPGDILEQLFNVLKGTYIGWAAAGTLVFVALIKMVLSGAFKISLEGRAAAGLAVFIQVVIWLLYNVAQYFGAADAFQSTFLAAVEVVKSLLPFVGALFGTQLLYNGARKYDVPLIGYKPPSRPKSNMIRG